MRQRERAGDHRLAGDDRGDGGEGHHGNPEGRRAEQEEPVQVLEGLAVRGSVLQGLQHQGPLSQVVEGQGRQDQEQPRRLDRPTPEVSHVRVERLGARHRQEHRTQHQQAGHAVPHQEDHRVIGVERQQDAGDLHELDRAKHRDGGEPDQADRPEPGRHLAGAPRLDQEKPDQDRQRDLEHQRRGHPIGQRRDRPQALDRRQHRDRRSDHRVAVEQRRSAQAQDEDHLGASAHRALGQGHQRQHPALAVIIGPHQEQHILDGDHEDQRPERQ